jgi:uncharacterized protein (TIGR03067 family)
LVRTVFNCSVWLVVAFVTTPLSATPEASTPSPALSTAEADLLQVQGRWERDAPGPAYPYRTAVKEVTGEEEVLTYYKADASVWRSHRAQFKLSRSGSVKVFTFSNVQITEGDGKGARNPGPSSYIYVATDREFKEVSGFLPGQESQAPAVLVWRKAKEEPNRVAALPKPDARLQGTWIPFHSEEGGVDRRDQGNYVIKFEGDRFVAWRNGALMLRGTVTTYSAREPRRVDILIREDADNPSNVGKTLQGIYAIDGQELSWCTGTTAAPKPPTEFATHDGDPFMLVRMKRKTPLAAKD